MIGLFEIDITKANQTQMGMSYCGQEDYFWEREIWHMRDFYNAKIPQNYSYSALLSPKFQEKTNLSKDDIQTIITSEFGYDAYYFFPTYLLAHKYLYYNVWDQGEAWHTGIFQRADYLLRYAHYPNHSYELGRMTLMPTVLCNQWIGNHKFWSRLFEYLTPLIEAVEKDKRTHGVLYERCPYRHNQVHCYVPFIFERLMSNFIYENQDLKIWQTPTRIETRDEKMFDLLSKIIQLDNINAPREDYKQPQRELSNYLHPHFMTTTILHD